MVTHGHASGPYTDTKMTGTSAVFRMRFISSIPSLPGSIRSSSSRCGFSSSMRRVTSSGSPVTLSPSATVEEGAKIAVSMSFGNLESDSDPTTVDYVFRADVKDAGDGDACEGDGLGVDRNINRVDQDPETRAGTVSGPCPAGDYAVVVTISSPDNTEPASARAPFTVAEPPPAARGSQLSTTIDLDNANGGPKGIWSNGTVICVVDSDDSKLYAYNLSGGTRNAAKEITLDSGNGDAGGVWGNGTTIWVADRQDDKLYAYKMTDGASFGDYDSAKDITLHSDNANSQGIWSDGTTMWVVDRTDDRLYAYQMSDKTRDPAREFDLHADNESPGGIWSDGNAMWVLDFGDTHMYSYTLNGDRSRAREFGVTGVSSTYGIWSDGATLYVTSDKPLESTIDTFHLGARIDLVSANGEARGLWTDGTTPCGWWTAGPSSTPTPSPPAPRTPTRTST